MEKAQVIKELKALKEAFEEERDAYPICLEEAIRLLEQPDGCDMISRKAAIDAIKTWGLIDGLSEGQAIEILADEEKLPSEQPERTGRWIRDGEQMIINLENAREQYAVLGYPHRKYLKLECSVCKMLTLVDSSIKYEFCPHCGARMEGAE